MIRRAAAPALLLAILVLLAGLGAWRWRSIRTTPDDAANRGAHEGRGANATAGADALGTADGAASGRAGLATSRSDGRDAGAGDGDGDGAQPTGMIGDAFTLDLSTATPVPLLDRTALLPLTIMSDSDAIDRAIERRAEASTGAASAGTPGARGLSTASAWPAGAAAPTGAPGTPAGRSGTSGVPAGATPVGSRDAAGSAQLGVHADIPADAPAWQRSLLAERVGYGRAATGGLGGRVVRVTTLDDEGDGSIRQALGGSGPRWVVFDVSGVIDLGAPLRVPSDTTLDGRGTYVALQGSGLDIRDVRNVIVSHLVLERGNKDAVSVRARAQDVWLNHLTLRDFTDGLIDVTREATNVTISWCRFEDHEKVMLVGGDGAMPQDAVIRVTMHHNLFDHTGQRQPRLRFGRVHAFNNVLDRWASIGMAANYGGELLVERNVFLAGPDAEEAVRAGAGEDAPGRVRAVGNRLWVPDDTEGALRPATEAEIAARIEQRHPERVFDPAAEYPYRADPAGDTLLARVRAEAGWQPAPPLPSVGAAQR